LVCFLNLAIFFHGLGNAQGGTRRRTRHIHCLTALCRIARAAGRPGAALEGKQERGSGLDAPRWAAPAQALAPHGAFRRASWTVLRASIRADAPDASLSDPMAGATGRGEGWRREGRGQCEFVGSRGGRIWGWGRGKARVAPELVEDDRTFGCCRCVLGVEEVAGTPLSACYLHILSLSPSESRGIRSTTITKR
jgi:hypothetical protein